MMYDINRLPDVIEIGKTGEHLFRPIQFNMRSWLAVLPEGVPSVILIRPGETSADSYIAATEFEDGILTWKPTAADVENDGYGHIEVWLEQAAEDPEDTDPTGKSASARTHIEKSIGPADGETPEPQAGWMEQMNALKVATVDAAENAEDAKTAAETAQGKAEDAQTAAETAQGKAEDAQTAAETAQGKAEDAQEAAEEAQAAAEAAQEAAEDAQEAAETAQGKAEDAQTAAEAAQDAAEDAAEDAGDAKDDAVDAKEDAEAAQAAAEAAQAAAEAAQAAAEAAAGTYPYIDSTTGNWMVWDADTGAYVDTGIKARPNVVRVQDTQPTDADGMIWFPETAPASVQVPTVSEMNTAIGALIDDTGTSQSKVWSAAKTSNEINSKQDVLRVASLTQVPVASGQIVDSVGVPVYVDDVTDYSGYGITDTGWYAFVRITAKGNVTVSAQTAVTGADGYIATTGADHVDVAVRFGVAAQSKTVTVAWDSSNTETFVFRATDLAVRNLDYRTTFYIYDITDFATWTWALTADETFQSGVNYYTEDGGEYTLATVTVGDAVPADTYYVHTKLTFSGMIRNVTYRLNEIVDCPIEIVLPEVPNDGYGAWFEIQMQYSKQVSTTLLPTDNTVVIGTANTQAQNAGINVIDLQYTEVNGVKMWTLLNTHSNLPSGGA